MYFLLLVLLAVCTTFLAKSLSAETVFVFAATAAMLVVLAALRLASIGWHAALCLIGFLPLVNEAFAVVLLALPPNFAKERKLDSPGRIILAVGAVLLLVRYAVLALKAVEKASGL